ncbi:LysR family transcriptional regulator [soil metagenome]
MVNSSLSRLDLNLLVALDALLRERSVTVAAQSLSLSQPALSASLSRLRTHFQDPLLARRGNSYELTPLAARLAENTTAALESVRRVFASEATFDPTETVREFTIYGSDYSAVTIGRRVARLAAERAPQITFRFLQHTPLIVEDALNVLRLADGIIIPHGFIGDLPYMDVMEDNWVCIVADDNPSVGDELTLANLHDLPWVTNYHSQTAYTPPVRQMQLLGIEPKVVAVVEGFLTLPMFIAGTNRIALLQQSIASQFSETIGIRVMTPPFEALKHVGALWWHPMHDRDPAHEWMRSLFAEARLDFGNHPDL